MSNNGEKCVGNKKESLSGVLFDRIRSKRVESKKVPPTNAKHASLVDETWRFSGTGIFCSIRSSFPPTF